MEQHYITWARSLDARIRHENKLMEEATKMAQNPKYVPSVKIGRRYKEKFKFIMEEAARREKIRRKKEARKRTAMQKAQKKGVIK